MNQSSHPLETSNGSSAHGETAFIERRAASNNMSPAGEWRDASAINASGRYAVEESGGLDLSQILGIGRRRWKIMLAAMIVCIAASAYVVSRSKPVYQAQATLEMNLSNRSQVDTSAFPGLAAFDSQTRGLYTQLELLKGPKVRAAAYDAVYTEGKKKGMKILTPDLRARLRGESVFADQRGNSNLVDVQVRALDPEAAAALANAICLAYQETSQEKNEQNSAGAIQYVKNQIADVGNRLENAQNNLSRFKKLHGGVSLSDAGSALTSSLGAKKAALEQAQTQRAASIAQLQDQQSQLNRIPANQLVPTGIQQNPAIGTLQSQLTQKIIERSTLLNEYQPTSYKVKAIDADIASLRLELSRQKKTEVTSFQPDPRRAPLMQSVATLQSQVLATDATISELNQQIVGTQAKVNQLPDQEFRYAQLEGEVDLQSGIAKQLALSQQNLILAQKSQTPDATLAFPASVNYGPVAPDKRRIVLTGIIMGLLTALALAMLVDALDNRIYTEDDAQRATHLPLLAQIPFIKKADQQSLYLTGNRVSPLLESNRMLRANISFCATDRPVKALVVTSSVPHEGKSSSALNLAVAAALGGENVILIDLDLRRPTQHVLTGLPNTAGFTNIIAGQVSVASALQDTPIPNLRVLTSGPTPPNPYRMLNSQAAKATIEKLVSMADFVVIDTPPVLGLADARLISSLVDGTLMVVSCQETGRREASRAAEMMASANQEVLGAILTKVPNSATAYGSYHTYHRYGRYFDESQSTAEKMDEAALAGKLDAAPRDK
ncbi:tyrosine-protein kinase YwqD [Abditibacteriota bacterium]|nr:tyrosine-protein kinase YwqD [Abditibacteriota bacterium]